MALRAIFIGEPVCVIGNGRAVFDLMDTIQIVSLVAGSSLAAALLTQGVGWIRDAVTAHSKKKAHASYLALRLAILLEAYAYACATIIQKNGNAETRPDEQYPDWEVKLPPLPEYPDDAEGWRSLKLDLASRALALRNRIDGSQAIIDVTIEYAEHELEEELDGQFGARGMEAFQIAADLRRRYDLDAANLIYDFTDTLIGAVASAKRTKEESRKRNAEMMAQWSSQKPGEAIVTEN